MGFNSQTGQFGIGIQSVKGTPVAASRFMRLRSGSLGGDRSLLIPDPEIGGNRDIPEAYLGPVAFSGDIEFYPRMKMLAVLAKGCLGASSSGTVAGTTEVQTLTITGTPTGGTFALRFRGQTTTGIAYNAVFGAVDTALEALSTIGAGNVAVTGGPGPGTPYVITFSGTLATSNPPAIEVVNKLFTGGTAPNAAITTTTPGIPVIGTHIITPADTSPWLTIEERISNELESFRYVDGKVNRLRIEADAEGYLMGSATMLAISQTSGFVEQTNPAWDESPMMVGGQVTVKLNGSTFLCKGFNLEVNNNIEDNDFYLGSVFLGDAVEKRREVTAGFTYRPQDATLWKQATYGDSAFTTPAAARAYRGPVEINITSFETIGDVVAGTPYSCKIEIPAAVVAPFKLAPSGDDVIQQDLEIRPIRPDSAVPIMTWTIVDDFATVT